MKPGEVKGDAEFTSFQAKLATCVANALSGGEKISSTMADGCRCPLGCHPESTWPYPPSPVAAREGWAEVSIGNLRSFIAGYSKQRDWTEPGAYHVLGLAYREMFQ